MPESKPHSTPELDHLIERLEWMHYLGTKSFPHEAGDCELCAAESEIRDGLRSLFEQLEVVQRERDDLEQRLADFRAGRL